jgi:hypothetical protein
VSKFKEKKLNITVLVTSISQREITIETANYYSEICREVILVDEQQPHLSVDEISVMRKKGVTYIPYINNGCTDAGTEKPPFFNSSNTRFYYKSLE